MRGDGAVAELIQALDACGGPLAPLDQDGRAVLARLERELPDYFLQVRNIVYLSYYESPAVHEAIRAMGFVYNAIPLPRATTSAGSIPRPTCRATRGVFVATGDVQRVDLSQLDFLERGHGRAACKKPADVLVIGSGASGAIASMVLGQAGCRWSASSRAAGPCPTIIRT